MASNRETEPSYIQELKRDYVVKKSYIISLKGAIAFFYILMLLSLTIPFFPDTQNDIVVAYVATFFSFVIFVAITLFFYFDLWQHRRHQISTDEDGLWYTRLGKERGLVCWHDIFRTKRVYDNYVALDSQGRKLIHIIHRLTDSHILLNHLHETVKKNIADREASNTGTIRDFSVLKGTHTKARLICMYFFFITAFFSVVLFNYAFFEDSIKRGDNYYLLIFMSIIVILGLVSLTIITIRKAIILSYTDITLDEDGLWYKKETKETGLIPWKHVYKLKDNLITQSLDVLDKNGSRLIRLEYELNDFILLRDRLLEKVEDNYKDDLSDCFPPGIMHHLISALILTVFLAPCLYVYYLSPEWVLLFSLLPVICALVFFYFYLTSEYRITVKDHQLVILSLARKKSIDFADIKSVNLIDQYDEAIKGSKVSISIRGNKDILLHDMFELEWPRVDTYALYLTLKNAVEEYQAKDEEKVLMDKNNEPSQSEIQIIAQEFNMRKSELISIMIAMLIFSALLFVGITIPFWPTSEKDISAYLILLFILGLWSLIVGILYSYYKIARHADIVIDEDGLWYKEIGKASGLVPWNQMFKIIMRGELSIALDENDQQLIRIHHSLNNYAALNKMLTQAIIDNIARGEAQDTKLTREFCISKKVVSEKQIWFWLTFSITALLLAFLFYQHRQHNLIIPTTTDDSFFHSIFNTFCILTTYGFSIATIFLGLKSKRLPYASIAFDDDGLWYRHIPKASGLIPWNKIHRLKEEHLHQCMDIFDFSGSKVMRAEYELTNFVVLRNRLLDKVAHNNQLELADCFAASNIRRILVYGATLVLILLAGYFGGNLSPDTSSLAYLGSLACAIILIGTYLFSISSVSIQDNKFFFNRPAKKDVVDFADIKSFELIDGFNQGGLGNIVKFTTNDYKVYNLSAYACVDAHVLYLALKKAIERYQENNKQEA